MRIPVFAFLLASMAGLLFGGCTDDKPKDPDRVSTIPWNRPEQWEGKGALGGMAPGTQ